MGASSAVAFVQLGPAAQPALQPSAAGHSGHGGPQSELGWMLVHLEQPSQDVQLPSCFVLLLPSLE